MSNLELDPPETLCGDDQPGAGVEVIEPRDVPLGGPRAMSVRRTLPSKQRSLVGAWCFLDHYGPDDVSRTGGMKVPPHPHTGLQTVSWLFTGEIEHRDSAGHHAMVRPGELNLMTAGRGINHSEYSTPSTTVLHGVQLWTALPETFRFAEPSFERYVPEPVALAGDDGAPAGELRVFLGALNGSASPVRTYTAVLGAELVLEPGAAVNLGLEPEFEHAILPDGGSADIDGESVAEAHLAYLAPGRRGLQVTNPGPRRIRAVVLGGPPFGEEITMWWNFVGRTHEEIVGFRSAWNAQIGAEPAPGIGTGAEPVPAEPVPAEAGRDGAGYDGAGFGPVVEPTGGEAPLPAPPLPHVRLRPRPAARPHAAGLTAAETPAAGKPAAAMPGPLEPGAEKGRNAGMEAGMDTGTETGTEKGLEAEAGRVTIVHAPQRHRYEVHVGDATAGFTQYRLKDEGTVIAFDHTEVGDGYSGLGLASRLVTFALDDVRANGQRVRPYCPYVRAFIKRHAEYRDLVADGFEL
jgi:redox-sensitive bicupin YhaK (pirin superfamily)/predicted GNAT family acetyltransferase